MTIRNNLAHIEATLGIMMVEANFALADVRLLDSMVAAAVAARNNGPAASEERIRLSVRNMLRNGRYRPSGRAKPASEYLAAAARDKERGFPRILPAVDIANMISLRELLPVSAWDLDRMPRQVDLTFRLGGAGEQYIFNTAGQSIDLQDLIVGCTQVERGTDCPIVSPVKDSMATKTTADTTRLGVCIYAPTDSVSPERLDEICRAFERIILELIKEATVRWAVVGVGERVEL